MLENEQPLEEQSKVLAREMGRVIWIQVIQPQWSDAACRPYQNKILRKVRCWSPQRLQLHPVHEAVERSHGVELPIWEHRPID